MKNVFKNNIARQNQQNAFQAQITKQIRLSYFLLFVNPEYVVNV